MLAWAGSAMAAPAGTLTLNEAYRIALAHSEQVQEAMANRELAAATYTDALTVYGPQLSVVATSLYENRALGQVPAGQLPVGQQVPYGVRMQASLSQPVLRRYFWDQRRAAKFGIESNDEAVRRARQQLMFDVTTAFVGIMQARQQYVIAVGAVKRATVELESAERRVNSGGELPAQKYLAQVDLNRAQIQLNTADGNVRIVESQLQRLIGVPPPETLLLPPTPHVDSIAEIIERSRKSRSDLKSLRYATLQALATVSQLQNKIFWPTIDVNGQAGYNVEGNAASLLAGQPKDYRFPSYGLTGTFTIPIFQNGDEFLQVRMQRARVSFAAAAESYEWKQVQDDVREANARLEIARKGMDLGDEQEKAARNNYELIERGYRLQGGKSGLLDLVTAQAAVFEAQTNRVLAVYAYELAVYQLLFAEGTIDL
jgi:outer membrane protein